MSFRVPNVKLCLRFVQLLELQGFEDKIDDEGEDQKIDEVRQKVPNHELSDGEVFKTVRATEKDADKRIHDVGHKCRHDFLHR